MPTIEFGDMVRIRATPETVAAELAGLVGQVFGWTTPSIIGATVIGASTRDYAINVFFEDRSSSLWFDEDLLEFVDRPELEITIGASRTRRTADGNWEQMPSRLSERMGKR